MSSPGGTGVALLLPGESAPEVLQKPATEAIIELVETRAPWLMLAALPAAAVLVAGWVVAVRRGRSGKLALALRSAAAVLLALGAGALLVRSGGRPRALVMLDRSASMGAARRQSSRAALAAGRALADRFEVSYGSFALSAREESPETLGELVPDESGTDFAAALAFARERLRPGEPLLVVTDGLACALGDRRAALRWGELSPALVMLPAGPEGPDAALAELDAPAEVRPGERFSVSVRITGTASGPVKVTLTRTVRGGARKQVGTENLALPARGRGASLARFEERAPEGGLLEYTATLGARQDAESANNSARALVRVLSKLRVGVVLAKGRSSAAPQLLGAAGFDATPLTAGALPQKLGGFDAIFIDDVPRESFGEQARECSRLAEYVKRGGGLVVLGGPGSYAAGGYDDAGKLERVLPASMIPPDDRGLFAVLVLDRSGSMGQKIAERGGKKKLDFVKDAVLKVINPDSFGAADRLTLVAFAQEPVLLAGPENPADAGAAGRLRAAVKKIEVRGSTNLAAALGRAVELLGRARDPRVARHIILLSDGLLVGSKRERRRQVRKLEGLAKALAGRGATLSTVGTGSRDEDTRLLTRLARLGRGRFYRPARLEDLANIFRRDINTTRKARILKGSFSATTGNHPLGELLGGLPILEGRNRVSAKKDAWVALEAPAPGGRGREPLLLAWERGRGRAACFASSLGDPWGKGLLGEAEGKRFAGALARWAAGRSGRDGCRLSLSRERDGMFRLALFARDEGGKPLAKLKPIARVRGIEAALPLLQESPSRYAARFALATGAREVAATALHEGGELARGLFPLSHPRELDRVGIDRARINELARLAGGRTVNSPSELGGLRFARASGRGLTPAAPWLSLLALALVLAELGFRAVRR